MAGLQDGFVQERRRVADLANGSVLLLLQEDAHDVVRIRWPKLAKLREQKEVLDRFIVATASDKMWYHTFGSQLMPTHGGVCGACGSPIPECERVFEAACALKKHRRRHHNHHRHQHRHHHHNRHCHHEHHHDCHRYYRLHLYMYTIFT
jgi:hypothetical protein